MVNESKIVIVGGVPGVGKTTVINKVQELAKAEKMKITIIVFGSVMMEIASELFNFHDRDNLRKLPSEKQKIIQKEAAVRIAKRSWGKLTIVDTHYTIKTRTGKYLQGIPSWVSNALKPKLLVLIETNPVNISKRRSVDDSRLRDEENLDLLKEHQEINRTSAATICQKTGALLAIIKNKQDLADEAGEKLLIYLKSI
ncbi:MAG: adenylate kinase [Candidatus Heimdallarchaeota archaeon]